MLRARAPSEPGLEQEQRRRRHVDRRVRADRDPDGHRQGEGPDHAAAQEQQREHGDDRRPGREQGARQRLVDAPIQHLHQVVAGVELEVLADPVVDDDRVVEAVADDREQRGQHLQVELEPQHDPDARGDEHVVDQGDHGARREARGEAEARCRAGSRRHATPMARMPSRRSSAPTLGPTNSTRSVSTGPSSCSNAASSRAIRSFSGLIVPERPTASSALRRDVRAPWRPSSSAVPGASGDSSGVPGLPRRPPPGRLPAPRTLRPRAAAPPLRRLRDGALTGELDQELGDSLVSEPDHAHFREVFRPRDGCRPRPRAGPHEADLQLGAAREVDSQAEPHERDRHQTGEDHAEGDRGADPPAADEVDVRAGLDDLDEQWFVA